jgi:hypothetical protein
MKEIKLGRGTDVTLVDDEDYDYLIKLKWSASKKGDNKYAIRRQYVEERNEKGRKKTVKVSMHRIILGVTDKNQFIDHIDGNGLNNQRSNLRLASSHENNRNIRKKKNCSSKYKGVSWLPKFKKWKVDICVDGKKKGLGLFKNEEEAARAYDRMAKIHFGEFAWLNFKECKSA